ncbi:hypothetical protein [Kineococcus sp. NUM-3379]
MRAPKTVGVALKLGIFEVSGEWEPGDVERSAAWELYVELVTRVAVVPLRADEGLLREALTSLHSLFGTTREILRQHGPEVARPRRDGSLSFGILAVTVLDAGLRPLLSRWHPALEDWEAQRPEGVSSLAHERAWPQAVALREELAVAQGLLKSYADTLAAACGVPDLLDVLQRPSALS